jgi:2-hydroxychromene-2-carboxylate isomerase
MGQDGVITFHFDFISPYSYLAWTQIHALAARHGRRVVPVPTLLAALLAHGATKGPAEIPAKRAYLVVDTVRTARLLGVPLVPPASHPFNPLLPLRVASLDGTEDERRARIDALFTAAWAKGEPIDTDEAVTRVLGDRDLATRAREPAAKERLRAQTDAAIAAGVFGVPTMNVDGSAGGTSQTPNAHGDMFWGVDSLGHLERHLRGEGVDTGAEMAKWLPVRATASRL